jgi:hypothetical protein
MSHWHPRLDASARVREQPGLGRKSDSLPTFPARLGSPKPQLPSPQTKVSREPRKHHSPPGFETSPAVSQTRQQPHQTSPDQEQDRAKPALTSLLGAICCQAPTLTPASLRQSTLILQPSALILQSSSFNLHPSAFFLSSQIIHRARDLPPHSHLQLARLGWG